MNFLKFTILVSLAIAGTGKCFLVTQNKTDNKRTIGGGDFICIDKAPYQVYLKEEGPEYFCGGALIRPNIVLTAAHCVLELENRLFVVAGTDSTELENNESRVEGSVTKLPQNIIVHPDFNFNDVEYLLKYDIAIIKLEEDFPVNNRISPIKIATVDVKENDELLLTGIGMINKDADGLSPCLKAYKPNVLNCQNALSSLRLRINNYDGVICHKSPLGHTSRLGDSGGPLVNSKGQLVGIHTSSYGDDVCQTGVNVLHHLQWIQEEISIATNEMPSLTNYE